VPLVAARRRGRGNRVKKETKGRRFPVFHVVYNIKTFPFS
jgi:hypothetical protein